MLGCTGVCQAVPGCAGLYGAGLARGWLRAGKRKRKGPCALRARPPGAGGAGGRLLPGTSGPQPVSGRASPGGPAAHRGSLLRDPGGRGGRRGCVWNPGPPGVHPSPDWGCRTGGDALSSDKGLGWMASPGTDCPQPGQLAGQERGPGALHHCIQRWGRSSQSSHGCSINRAAAAPGAVFSVCLCFCFSALSPA